MAEDRAGGDTEVERIALELYAARGRELRAESFRDADTIRSLPSVQQAAERLGSDTADGALHELLRVFDDELDDAHGKAAKAFFGVGPAKARRSRRERNSEAASLLEQSDDRWQRKETHLAFLREVARAVVRGDKTSGLRDSSPPAAPTVRRGIPAEVITRAPRFRLSFLDGAKFPHPIDRASHDFLRGLISPWREGHYAPVDGEELASLWGFARLLSIHASPSLALSIAVRYIRTLEVDQGDSLGIEHDDDVRLYICHPSTDSDDEDPVLYHFRVPYTSDVDASRLRNAVEGTAFNEVAVFAAAVRRTAPALVRRWSGWLASCGCPVDHAWTESDRRLCLFESACTVHRNFAMYFGNNMVTKYFWVKR